MDKKRRRTKTRNPGGNGEIVVLSPSRRIDAKGNTEDGKDCRVIENKGEDVAYFDPCVRSQAQLRSPYFLTTNPNLPKRIRNTSLNESTNASTKIKNTPFSFSLPFPQRHFGTPQQRNNLLDDGFSAVVCCRGGLLNGVCRSCAEGGVVGRTAPYHPQNTATAACSYSKRCTQVVVPLTPRRPWEIAPLARE